MAATDRYSAREQGLGYMYQARFALLQILKMPESTSLLIEKDDDIDFVDADGHKTLGSLKHRADGNKLTDLSTDFWKSVRIWLARYKRDGRIQCALRFFLFTTSKVAERSFLQSFLPEADPSLDRPGLAKKALGLTESPLVKTIRDELSTLHDAELNDFLARVLILERGPRIDDLPALIVERYMRSIRREFRPHVFERLEGWWTDQVINLLTGKRRDPIVGNEVSDKLAVLADEYKADNLPINFRGAMPETATNAISDPRLFVAQLREIGINKDSIQFAILDYYRAYEQRSMWARQQVIDSEEVELYEDRLVEEWGRYKAVIFEDLDETSAETTLVKAGKELYRWAQLANESLRIRARVTEPYVTRGGFHMLANVRPQPRVHWHPRFLARVGALLGTTE